MMKSTRIRPSRPNTAPIRLPTMSVRLVVVLMPIFWLKFLMPFLAPVNPPVVVFCANTAVGTNASAPAMIFGIMDLFILFEYCVGLKEGIEYLVSDDVGAGHDDEADDGVFDDGLSRFDFLGIHLGRHPEKAGVNRQQQENDAQKTNQRIHEISHYGDDIRLAGGLGQTRRVGGFRQAGIQDSLGPNGRQQRQASRDEGDETTTDGGHKTLW